MAQYLIEDTTLTGIANAIREKEGSTGTIPVPDMEPRIRAIAAGGGSITINSDEISFDTSDPRGGTLVIDTYVLLRIPVPFEMNDVNFLMVSVCGNAYSSSTDTSASYKNGAFSSSGVMDNRDRSNTSFLFTGGRSYSYEEDDGNIKFYSWDDDDLPFYNSSLNCFEFRVAASSGQDTVLSLDGNLFYWYF